MGSIALPGALVMVNNDLSASVQNRLQIQLHINETITGQDLDLRIAADPGYPQSIRALQQRVMVMRDFRETANRTEMDVVIFVRESMVYIEKNCFGPTGQAFYLSNIYWGQLGIFDTNLHRSCKKEGCGCGKQEEAKKDCGCHGNCGCDTTCKPYDKECNCCGSSGGIIVEDGRSPYYPARCDPKYPRENHWYNQVQSTAVFGGCGCGQSPDRVLCRVYKCDADGHCVPLMDCRLVKQ
jgi:hypothetical protein